MVTLDQRCLQGLFAQRFGAVGADPSQAFRQPPTVGIVYPAAMSSSGSNADRAPILPRTPLGSRAAEVERRHATFLDSIQSRSAMQFPNMGTPASSANREHACRRTAHFGFSSARGSRGRHDLHVYDNP